MSRILVTCPRGPTSQPSSERASRLYVGSGACGDLCHDTPCWPWFVHWLSARWTTATRFSLVSPASRETGCSPSWMPPPVWFSQRGGQNAWPPLLRELHWLRVPERVTFRLCVLAYRCLHGTAPAYLAESLHRTSDVDTRRRLRSADSHAGGTVHQTFNTRWPCLPSGFCACVEQPAVVCQECIVADDVPSRAEDCSFPVVVWEWLGDRDCTAQYNCCLPATTDCRRFCCFVCFSFHFNFVRCPCNVLTW